MSDPKVYIPGEWKALCDICGFYFTSSELFEDYRGLRVCKKDLDNRNPQEFVRAVQETIKVPWVRPDDTSGTITNILIGDIAGAFTVDLTSLLKLYTINTSLTANVAFPAANDAGHLGMEVVYYVEINATNTSVVQGTFLSSSSRVVGNTTILLNTPSYWKAIPSQNTWLRLS